MMQITMDDLIANDTKKKLICCSLTPNYHWLRISQGHTPEAFTKKIEFELDEYEYLYIRTKEKDEILAVFDGSVEFVPFDFSK